MALSAHDKKVAKLAREAVANPNGPALGTLAVIAWDAAVSLRDMLVAQGKMTVPQQ